ncbi:aldose 1-epimerase family protein [Bacillus sp. Marseille-Q3570]|uniref:aldose 1-epimerase family protein n=1 Tax=Bacillus sp. Marseille-Q3570 TaxID=2963522 RepID=UPI0021B79D04|nr:aldose 1-epimerase family protein [Bacillus sp. Marseille-Q3570]
MKLYGRSWTRQEIEARVGRIEQIGGLKGIELLDGREKGVEQIQVRTGSGLTAYVTPTKGFDISLAEYGGVPLSWQSPNGDCHPFFFNPVGKGWLRSASGGLLMTCGLSQVGTPSRAVSDENTKLGLHGRAHHTPAKLISAEGYWENDEYRMILKGDVEETGMFVPNLRLKREIHFKLGENRFSLKDEVENIGFQSAPHMILYHFNFGFPLMDEDTMVHFPSKKVESIDKDVSQTDYDNWQNPEANIQEKVYYHRDIKSMEGRHNWSQVTIFNPHFPTPFNHSTPLSVTLKWCTDTLPNLIEWKMPGEKMHVLGIEPSNCLVEGQEAEQENETLVYLEPGEKRTYQLEFEVNENLVDNNSQS